MKRRAFLKAVAATSVGPFFQGRSNAVESDGPACPGLLDTLRDKIHRWTESLWDPDLNGFRQNDLARWRRVCAAHPEFPAPEVKSSQGR